MVFLGKGEHVKAWFGLFGDRANLDARLVHGIPYALKSIWMHPIELLDDVCHMNLTSVHLEIVLVSMQDRCMVCA